MSDVRTIKFTASCSPYSIGDVAGFSRKNAAEYIKAGVAVAWPAESEAPNVKQAPPKKRAFSRPRAAKSGD